MQKLSIFSFLSLLILFLLSPFTESKSSSENISSDLCPITKCSENGPSIRFPFRLKTQPIFCGHDGFELSCSNSNTILHLPSSSSDFHVLEISYHDSTIAIRDGQETTSCPIQNLLSFNITDSKFFFFPFWAGKTLVNCSEMVDLNGAIGPVECVSGDKNFVYVMSSYAGMDQLPSACRTYKSFLVSTELDLVKAILRDLIAPRIVLGWNDFDGCHGCEQSGDICSFNLTSNSTICLKQPGESSSKFYFLLDVQLLPSFF